MYVWEWISGKAIRKKKKKSITERKWNELRKHDVDKRVIFTYSIRVTSFLFSSITYKRYVLPDSFYFRVTRAYRKYFQYFSFSLQQLFKVSKQKRKKPKLQHVLPVYFSCSELKLDSNLLKRLPWFASTKSS